MPTNPEILPRAQTVARVLHAYDANQFGGEPTLPTVENIVTVSGLSELHVRQGLGWLKREAMVTSTRAGLPHPRHLASYYQLLPNGVRWIEACIASATLAALVAGDPVLAEIFGGS